MDNTTGNESVIQSGGAQGGLIPSGLEFLEWRIRHMDLRTRSNAAFLFGSRPLNDLWETTLSFDNPLYLKGDALYLSTLGATMRLLKRDSLGSEDEEPLLTVAAFITGAFRFAGDEFDKGTRENLIIRQTPAILLPYLRGSIGSCVINSGFQAPPLPLINLYETTKYMPGLKIEEQDEAANEPVTGCGDHMQDTI